MNAVTLTRTASTTTTTGTETTIRTKPKPPRMDFSVLCNDDDDYFGPPSIEEFPSLEEEAMEPSINLGAETPALPSPFGYSPVVLGGVGGGRGGMKSPMHEYLRGEIERAFLYGESSSGSGSDEEEEEDSQSQSDSQRSVSPGLPALPDLSTPTKATTTTTTTTTMTMTTTTATTSQMQTQTQQPKDQGPIVILAPSPRRASETRKRPELLLDVDFGREGNEGGKEMMEMGEGSSSSSTSESEGSSTPLTASSEMTVGSDGSGILTATTSSSSLECSGSAGLVGWKELVGAGMSASRLRSGRSRWYQEEEEEEEGFVSSATGTGTTSRPGPSYLLRTPTASFSSPLSQARNAASSSPLSPSSPSSSPPSSSSSSSALLRPRSIPSTPRRRPSTPSLRARASASLLPPQQQTSPPGYYNKDAEMGTKVLGKVCELLGFVVLLYVLFGVRGGGGGGGSTLGEGVVV